MRTGSEKECLVRDERDGRSQEEGLDWVPVPPEWTVKGVPPLRTDRSGYQE